MQLTKRIQALCVQDERIQEMMYKHQIELVYTDADVSDADTTDERSGYYSFMCDLNLKRKGEVSFTDYEMVMQEDVLYLLELVLREFTGVVRSYAFDDYDYVEFVDAKTGDSISLEKEQLELFRKKKMTVEELLQ